MSIQEIKHKFYEVYPKIIPSDKYSCITVKPINLQKFEPDTIYLIEIFGMETRNKKTYSIYVANNVLYINHFFNSEQEHIIYIYKGDKSEENKLCTFHLYSLYVDLYNKKPYKGDFHIHTTLSDGKETPERVCALCRNTGLDFISITDHNIYNPSILMQKKIKDMGSDLIIYPGEEIHFHGREHILSIGGKEGITKKYINQEILKKELELYSEKIKSQVNNLTKGIDKDSFTVCKFVIEKIHETGGLASMPHPFWVYADEYHNASELFKYMYENKCFDAYELINGFAVEKHGQESNNLQVSYYQQQRARVSDMPIISGTDAHAVVSNKCVGNMYTVVFSEDLEYKHLCHSIFKGFSVVVDANMPFAFGEHRYVKYVLYLMREVFPIHDYMCSEEGRLMLKYLEYDEDSVESREKTSGEIQSYYNKIWDR